MLLARKRIPAQDRVGRFLTLRRSFLGHMVGIREVLLQTRFGDHSHMEHIHLLLRVR
jgi:hypothetical protein